MVHRRGVVAGPNDRIHGSVLHSLSQSDSATQARQLPYSGRGTD